MESVFIQKKFGGDYIADEQTSIMGIDQRFTSHFAERLKNLYVLETCTGGGFTTISLARTAKHVFTVEIDQSRQDQAIANITKAGLLSRVTFLHGDIMDQKILDRVPAVDAAFIDPDWAVTGSDHEYRFIHSTTLPPSDRLLDRIFEVTENVAMVQPPFISTREFVHLRTHEREKLYLNGSHELFCLYFGSLTNIAGETEFQVYD